MSNRAGPNITNETVYREALKRFLPTEPNEVQLRGWNEIDVLLVNGDAYVDHPSFGIPLLGRTLEKLGLRVAILSQPAFDRIDDFKKFGRPRLFIGVSSGTVDSMINNYTANKRPRSDDMYSEGGIGGNRPDYASQVYARLAREAWPETPIVVGGVEASLRRLAHYDYWSDEVRASVLNDLSAELLVFGMGEKTVTTLVDVLREAEALVRAPLSIEQRETWSAIDYMKTQRGVAYMTSAIEGRKLASEKGSLLLPSFAEVQDSRKKFAEAAYSIEYEASPYNGKRLIQEHGSRAIVINPPPLPLSTKELDAIHELPFAKDQHPRYKKRVPAADMIRFSVASTRGCYGGCSFCAITLHQGRIVQSRSSESVLKELKGLTEIPDFKGTVTDIGGPTANMFQTSCKSTEIQSQCRKLSCVHPKVCPQLQQNHAPQVDMLKKARAIPGIKNIRIASGLRYDLALSDKKSGDEYLKELITHHVGGHLKVAPEHMDDEVLHLMKKPGLKNFDEFVKYFEKISKEAGKEQYVVPYFISGVPGTTHEKMEKVYDYLKEKGWNLQQVQGFIPTPMTLATAMYHTGIDPMTKKELFVVKTMRDRKIQQALLQPSKPEHKEIIREYMSMKRRKEVAVRVEAGEKRIFKTTDSRMKPGLLAKLEAARKAGLVGKHADKKQRKGSIVEPPEGSLGPKLYLDER